MQSVHLKCVWFAVFVSHIFVLFLDKFTHFIYCIKTEIILCSDSAELNILGAGDSRGSLHCNEEKAGTRWGGIFISYEESVERTLAMRFTVRHSRFLSEKIWATVCLFSLYKNAFIGVLYYTWFVAVLSPWWGDVVATAVAVCCCGFISM